MVTITLDTDIPELQIQWLLFLFKLERVRLVKGTIDYYDADRILNVIDSPNRIKKPTNESPDSIYGAEVSYGTEVSAVLDSDIFKSFLEEFKPKKQ